jgi:hypothetical protein
MGLFDFIRRKKRGPYIHADGSSMVIMHCATINGRLACNHPDCKGRMMNGHLVCPVADGELKLSQSPNPKSDGTP